MKIILKPGDIQIESFRSATAASNQRTQKMESAIKMTHIPTGVTIEYGESLSQHKNREKCMKLLAQRVGELLNEKFGL